MQDIIVQVALDTKRKPVETLMPLILGFEGAQAYAEYEDLAALANDYETTTDVYKAAAVMLAQDGLSGAPLARIAAMSLAADADSAAATGALTTLRSTHDDWYYLVPVGATSAILTGLAAWAAGTVLSETDLKGGVVEAEKLLVADQDTATTAITSGQTALCYNPDADSYMAAAWVGRMAPYYPTCPTWKWKELAGVAPVSLAGTALTNLLSQNINTYVRNHKREYMRDGVCADGEYIDVVIGRWRIKQLMRKAITDLAVDTAQIPYTDAGFTAVGAAVLKALQQAASDGIIAVTDNTPQLSINIPTTDEATELQRASRTMPPITWTATLTGSVHSMTVSGTLSVSLTA